MLSQTQVKKKVKWKKGYADETDGDDGKRRRVSVKRVKKETLIKTIEDEGCKMLKDKLDGDETKEEIVEYLKECDCPVLKKRFSGI